MKGSTQPPITEGDWKQAEIMSKRLIRYYRNNPDATQSISFNRKKLSNVSLVVQLVKEMAEEQEKIIVEIDVSGKRISCYPKYNETEEIKVNNPVNKIGFYHGSKNKRGAHKIF